MTTSTLSLVIEEIREDIHHINQLAEDVVQESTSALRLLKDTKSVSVEDFEPDGSISQKLSDIEHSIQSLDFLADEFCELRATLRAIDLSTKEL